MAEKLRKLKDAAARHLSKGRTDKALEAMLEVVKLEPHDLPSRQKCGDLFRKLHRYDEAIEAYQAVAGAYAADGLLLKAIAVCKVILVIDPQHKETQHTLAELYARKRGENQRAEMPTTMTAAFMPVLKKMSAASLRGKPVAELAAVVAPGMQSAAAIRGKSADALETEVSSAPLSLKPRATAMQLPQVMPPKVLPEAPEHLELLPDEGSWWLGDDEVSKAPAGGNGGTPRPARADSIEIDVVEVDEAVAFVEDDEIEADEVIEEVPAAEVSQAPLPATQPEPPRPRPVARRTESVTVDLRPLPPIPIFSDLAKNAFVWLLERLTVRQFEDGEQVLRQGEQGSSFFVVVSGGVRVVRRDPEQGVLELAHLGEGSFFGEMALLGDGARSADVFAVGATQLFELKKDMLREVIRQYPSVAQVLMRFYQQRLLTNLLSTSPLFTPFDAEERRGLIERFKSREIPRGTDILVEGQKGSGLYLLLSGRCEVKRKVKGRKVVLGELREGDVFGEMSMLTQQPVSATVTTTRRSIVLRLSAKIFNEVIMTHPQILELVSSLSAQREQANLELADLTISSGSLGMV